MTAAEIRQQFLDFFKSKQHHIVPSAPIVVKNDPTLLFTNAGMNQFKDYFLGNRPAPYPRVADTQKCLRVSGKHNDLEEVGVDTYHHTMFEMLGNWSFGDAGSAPGTGYFKKEAIAWSWELLTEVYQIPKDQLYVSVFAGDETEGLEKDQEAYDIWKQFVPEERIILGSKKDNFWEMGDTGPCGPCSEIHVDTRSIEQRADGHGASLVNADHPEVIEIWNNVFMEFNRLKDSTLQPLPTKHVDTGMGFERLVRVLQQKQSNYDTDVFSGTIATIENITGKRYTGTDTKADVAFRVLADHIRAIAFTIADGQLPSNTGAGYVIRRILRRAVRYYYSYLDYKQPLLHQLIPVIADQFALVFPELEQQKEFVARVVKEEEEAFLRTLEKGLRRLDELMTATSGNVIAGEAAFELFDTYGFPIDLTRLIAAEKGFTVDEFGFEKGLAEQKARSRAATALDTEDWVVLAEGQSTFVGYDTLETQTRMLRYRKVKAKGKESYQLVLEQTPFYAESGGQVGDKGELIWAGKTLPIFDTKKENDLIIHFATEIPADVSGEITARVSDELRKNTAVHHSATHLLHAALRQVLGTHVAQKGSLVNADYLRFDFSHFSKMSEEEIAQVEAIVNQKIRENLPVTIQEMDKEAALQMGAMALFGEKYSDKVRVVVMDPAYSVELCGGTHVARTGDLGFFKIKSEGAVAAGVRRIEALSGAAAEQYVNGLLQDLQVVKSLLKNPKDTAKAVQQLQEETAQLRRQLEAAENKALSGMAAELAASKEVAGNISFVGKKIEVSNAEALKKLCNDIKANGNTVVALGANLNGKAMIAIGVSDDLTATYDAGKLIKEVASPLIKGGGGGSKSLATAGGQNTDALEAAIEAVKTSILA